MTVVTRLDPLVVVRTGIGYHDVDGPLRTMVDELDDQSGTRLADQIRPGMHVLLKPNLVRHFHGRGDDPTVIVTHGKVVEAVVRLVDDLLDGEGLITVADAPQHDCDFESVLELAGIQLERLRSLARADVELLDLRPEAVTYDGGVVSGRVSLPGDPRGSREVDLGPRSALSDLGDAPFYGADYDTGVTRGYHSGGRHVYLVCNSPLQADVLINLPKLKTHKKTGVTCCLKNLVGINADKNRLPHFRMGTPANRGDEFADSSSKNALEAIMIKHMKRMLVRRGGEAGPLLQFAKRAGMSVLGDSERGRVRAGNWHGNDTAWRMVLDLNRILLEERTGPVLHVVDAIDVGVGDGPMAPDPFNAGCMIISRDPWAADAAASELLGFDPTRLPLLARAEDQGFGEFVTFQRRTLVDGQFADVPVRVDARPHFGWVGAVERRSAG